jgi:hypothetical protein
MLSADSGLKRLSLFPQELTVQLPFALPLAGMTDPNKTPYALLHGIGKSLAPNAEPATLVPAHWPAQGDLLDWCKAAGPGMAVILILLGIVFLLFGFSIFKVLVTLNAALLGGYIGMLIGEHNGVEVPASIIGALLSATFAWPTMKYSVAIMGGLFGMILGVAFWRLANLDPTFGWSGGMTGMVLFGLLSFLLFRECVITFTSLQGAVMLVFGLLGLLLKYQDVGTPLAHHFQIKPFLLPLTIFIPTLCGFIYQKAMIPGAPPAAPAKK